MGTDHSRISATTDRRPPPASSLPPSALGGFVRCCLRTRSRGGGIRTSRQQSNQTWSRRPVRRGALAASPPKAKQSLHSSLATLLWHRGPVTKSVPRANLARAAGPAAHAQRVPIAVGGRIRIPQESFPTGAGVGTGLPSRFPATPSLVPGWKAGGWSSRQIHQPGAVRTL